MAQEKDTQILAGSGYRLKSEHQAGPVGKRFIVESAKGGQRRLADIVSSCWNDYVLSICHNASHAEGLTEDPSVVRTLSCGWLSEEDYYQVTDLALEARPISEMGALLRLDERHLFPVTSTLLAAIRHLSRQELVHGAIAPETVYWEGESMRLGELWWLHNADGEPFHRELSEHLPLDWPFFALPYMAPEVLSGQPPDRESDLYSFGAMLYYFLSGENPRGVTSPAMSQPEIAALPARSIQRLVPGVSDRAAGIVHALLEDDPGARPNIFKLEALYQYLIEQPVSG